VRVTALGDIKLLDFGVAQAEFEGREAVTEAMVFGSPRYMAPERLAGVNSTEGEVYALGAVRAPTGAR
jgi:serine/threonine protein kinase